MIRFIFNHIADGVNLKTTRAAKLCLSWLASSVFALACCASGAQASTRYVEAKGAKDYPLMNRFQGATLYKYGVINFEQVSLPTPDGRGEKVEGKLYNYYYFGPKDHSDLEVYRSYKNALEQQHFKILIACEDVAQCPKQGLEAHARKWTDDTRTFAQGTQYMNNMGGSHPFRFLTARLARPSGDVTVVMTIRGDAWQQEGFGSDYFMQVIEAGPMQDGQVAIKADVLGKSLAADGKIALYGIGFDSGKADIKPQSKAQLDEMAKSLTQNTALKVYIVGHTDNQGTVESNLTLSQRRADAIVNALVKDYKIAPGRLAAKGVANYAPLSTNASDAGRAQNRRVEMVAQ